MLNTFMHVQHIQKKNYPLHIQHVYACLGEKEYSVDVQHVYACLARLGTIRKCHAPHHIYEIKPIHCTFSKFMHVQHIQKQIYPQHVQHVQTQVESAMPYTYRRKKHIHCSFSTFTRVQHIQEQKIFTACVARLRTFRHNQKVLRPPQTQPYGGKK